MSNSIFLATENGYPIFTLGFEQYLETVKNYIQSIDNLQSSGRQGVFTYPNMHTAMRMGCGTAADNVIERSRSRYAGYLVFMDLKIFFY